MADRKPPYSKKMRDRAKVEGWGLGTIDVVEPDGSRQTSWGPATPAKLEFLRWAGVCSTALDEKFLPDMKRIYRRAKARQAAAASKEESDGE